MESLLNSETDYLNLYIIPWGLNLIMALVIFIVGRWLAKSIKNVSKRLMSKAEMDEILTNFVGNMLYFALLIVVVIAALDRLGINTTSVMAIFAAAGLAVGLALKDSLSNFAAGVMLVFFKPFKAGDFIEAAGITGVVEQLRIFSTVMRTGDNREITIPNSHIYGGTIVNFSARDTRRIDLIFGIGYEDNIKQAKALIDEAMNEDERILKDPEPVILLMELADSSVNFAVRPWVNSPDYWVVRGDLMERVKEKFDANGISIPYPQQDLHLYKAEA
ncbi:MAG: mechanosensitive ion channel [Gammaproteobacteria bacterium]|nr:mechanosensitive ion channel [Gammaproteobacteria bacterium]